MTIHPVLAPGLEKCVGAMSLPSFCTFIGMSWCDLYLKLNHVQYNSTYSDAGYPDRLCSSGKFVDNSPKLTCFNIVGYLITYSTALWPLELQIRLGRNVQPRVHTVNRSRRNLNFQRRLFSKKNSIIRIFCISGWLAVPINPDKWSSAVPYHVYLLSFCV